NPISRRTLSTGTGNRTASLDGVGMPKSRASRGNNVANNCAWRGLSAWPLRRPKKAPRRAFPWLDMGMAVTTPPCWTCRAGASTGLAHRGPDVPDQVRLLPGEAAVFFRRTTEVAVGGGAAVDRPVQLERATDIGRREPENLG